MDIIGAIGYSGQDFVMLGQDNFGYITGKSVCIIGIAAGPKEMIWRPETGISRIASHLLTHRLVIAPEIAKFDIEVIDFLGDIDHHGDGQDDHHHEEKCPQELEDDIPI